MTSEREHQKLDTTLASKGVTVRICTNLRHTRNTSLTLSIQHDLILGKVTLKLEEKATRRKHRRTIDPVDEYLEYIAAPAHMNRDRCIRLKLVVQNAVK